MSPHPGCPTPLRTGDGEQSKPIYRQNTKTALAKSSMLPRTVGEDRNRSCCDNRGRVRTTHMIDRYVQHKGEARIPAA